MLNFIRLAYWNMVAGAPFAWCTGVQYLVSGTQYSHITGQNGPNMAQKGMFDPPKGSGATFERIYF